MGLVLYGIIILQDYFTPPYDLEKLMKTKRKDDKMVYGKAAVGTSKVVHATGDVVVIENLDAYFAKMLKK